MRDTFAGRPCGRGEVRLQSRLDGRREPSASLRGFAGLLACRIREGVAFDSWAGLFGPVVRPPAQPRHSTAALWALRCLHRHRPRTDSMFFSMEFTILGIATGIAQSHTGSWTFRAQQTPDTARPCTIMFVVHGVDRANNSLLVSRTCKLKLRRSSSVHRCLLYLWRVTQRYIHFFLNILVANNNLSTGSKRRRQPPSSRGTPAAIAPVCLSPSSLRRATREQRTAPNFACPRHDHSHDRFLKTVLACLTVQHEPPAATAPRRPLWRRRAVAWLLPARPRDLLQLRRHGSHVLAAAV